jgi:hypothetical protein
LNSRGGDPRRVTINVKADEVTTDHLRSQHGRSSVDKGIDNDTVRFATGIDQSTRGCQGLPVIVLLFLPCPDISIRHEKFVLRLTGLLEQ